MWEIKKKKHTHKQQIKFLMARNYCNLYKNVPLPQNRTPGQHKNYSRLHTNVKTSPTKTSEHCTAYDTEQNMCNKWQYAESYALFIPVT